MHVYDSVELKYYICRLVVPLVIRETVSLLKAGANASDTLDLSTYGFLYGTFPTAPGVFVYAAQYNLDVDLVSYKFKKIIL